MKNSNWLEFEELTEKIFKKLTRDSKYENVERNQKILGKDGTRQIDILLTTTTAGLQLLTVVECKHHSRKISVGHVDALQSKLQDINANKGIIVASKGFSSQAIAKAKRVGITLYTAHEAAHPNWDIDIEIPIVVVDIALKEVGPSITIPPGNFAGRKINYWKNNITINDKNILFLFREEWNSGMTKYELTEGKQKIHLNGIQSPFYFRDTNGLTIPIQDFYLHCALKIEYYLGFLKELADTQLIKDITTGQFRFFTDAFPIMNYKKVFRKIPVDQLPDNKLTLTLQSRFKINDISIQDFEKFPLSWDLEKEL